MRSITENTKVSVGILVLILGGYGFVLWQSFKGDAIAKDVEEIKTEQAIFREMATDIKVIRSDVEWLKRSRK